MNTRATHRPDSFLIRIGRRGPGGHFCCNRHLSALAIALFLFNPLNAAASDLLDPEEKNPTGNAVEEALNEMLNAQNLRRNNQYCQIVVLNEGKLGYMFGTNSLTTMGAAGQAARLEVDTSHNSFRLKIDAPYGFSVSPRDGNDNVIFTTSFSGHGATNFSMRPGTHDQKLRAGRTQITADLVAHRGSDPFPAGNYQAQVTLRCE